MFGSSPGGRRSTRGAVATGNLCQDFRRFQLRNEKSACREYKRKTKRKDKILANHFVKRVSPIIHEAAFVEAAYHQKLIFYGIIFA